MNENTGMTPRISLTIWYVFIPNQIRIYSPYLFRRQLPVSKKGQPKFL